MPYHLTLPSAEWQVGSVYHLQQNPSGIEIPLFLFESEDPGRSGVFSGSGLSG
jgi:hypothetical protein